MAPADWSAAQSGGEYTPAAFVHDGFVHFSFAHQVARVANAIYPDEPDLIAVEVDSEAVPAELLIEDCYESGEVFPHVYGPIPLAAARGSTPLTRGVDGNWEFIDPGGANAPASPDR